MPALVHSLADGKFALETPRLILRAARKNDAEALHLCFSDPEVMRYW
jgi:RimJ/RimL family protein N-acetyltransferase